MAGYYCQKRHFVNNSSFYFLIIVKNGVLSKIKTVTEITAYQL